ncbi:uncharacterized protein LOC131680897 [Topomyia yanbarensis]|uniref:uncharacterized protein LOC131680897 n=1 Tax=Topomyia yanbarensis TaxID=2498891 RepID=UPI00273B92B1|nr:uncharacterized protein LOC131680897 [Topomyia yanbarensis]
MSNDRRIKSLKLRLRSILTSFNLIKSFVNEFEEEAHATEVPVRLENLVTLWADFNKLQGELETLDESAVEQQLKQRSEVETHYYRVKGFLLSVNKVPVTPCAPSTNQSATYVPSSSSHIRLPDVKLPIFNGNLEHWLNFHDLYVSLVHSSQELSNIQKFYYLRSSLSGDALKLIQTIAISATNYSVAWNLLVEHFQDTARLKQSYIDARFEFPSIRRESATELHSLVERFEANVRVLQQLGEKTEFWDILLIRMLSIRLDPTTRRDWEEYSSAQDTISFHDLTSFLQRRVTVLQNLQGKCTEVPPPSVPKKQPQRQFASHGATQTNYRKCLVCSENHPLYQCATFSKMSPDDKEREVRRHQLCRNCLRKGHFGKDCPSVSSCRKCRGRHHTQLCITDSSSSGNVKTSEHSAPKVSQSLPPNDQPTTSLSATVPETRSYASTRQQNTRVLLATAVVLVVDDHGSQHVARALLDSGSECCFMTESFAQLVKAKRKKIFVPIAGIGQSTTHAKHKLFSTIRSRISSYSATVEFLILSKVTVDIPYASVDISSWNFPPEIQLADPSFHDKNSVDLVIGAEVFFDLFKVTGRIALGDNLPTLVNSELGWVVSGRTSTCLPTTPVTAHVATVTDLHTLMEKFWALEDDRSSHCHSVEEAACEEHFRQTVSRTIEGRYVVRLPIKTDVITNICDNRRVALRRFHLLEARLARNEELRQQYTEFLDEYLKLGHMQQIQEDDQPSSCYHLPHHAIIREDSASTKVRVVFDASCKTPNGPSLNEALMVGPIVQQDLRSIIMRSRKHRVMLIADIRQMYRQVLMDERDTPLQRIVWRPTPDVPINTYELKTITYGTASAPFLATRTLLQLANDERAAFPEAAEVLIHDFYVDDLFSGCNIVAETIALRRQLDTLLAKGGFELRKWASNEEEVLNDIPQNNRALQSSVDFNRDQCIKTLGLHWEPSSDMLRYKVKLPPPETNATLTKRIALSHIAQLFDPLGLVGPVVTTAKLFMQTLWTLKDQEGKVWGWDQELPIAIKERWQAYHSQLPLLNELRIDRCIMLLNPVTTQLHIFSDASELAYGACVYVRTTNSSGAVNVALLTAKSKVAPLKKQSIPRLELCGALIAAELYEKVSKSLQLVADTYFWVDSTTVLSWLKSPPSTWTTFVANRVSKIQLATEHCTWNHVSGQQNPADSISRGASAESLLNNTLWWSGSHWLQSDDSLWPAQLYKQNMSSGIMPETRKTLALEIPASTEKSFIDEYVDKFSNYQRMLRVTAYCRRFILNNRLETINHPKALVISSEEMLSAETKLIGLVQKQVYSEEWKRLHAAQPVSSKSQLKWFHPIIASDQLIRIGGRLQHSQQTFDSKHQILLPSKHPFSLLLVRHYHETNLHAAPQLLLTILRLRYWITGARNLARSVIHRCVICFRARPKLVEQFMADLPASRVTETRPFSVAGVDYWGPVLLQPTHRRAAPTKAYVAVFICFCTKAVHLELVADLTTAKFLQALRRFVSRRGLCSDLHSDNGRNFVGAANELRQLVRATEHQQAIAQECSSTGIRWHFNPPKASHFGGLWEAAIYSAQKHFVRVLGTHNLPFDEMETLLAQIECCLNSRPIVPLSDDPTDYEPLTPGHFLTGSALKAVPDIDFNSVPYNRLRKWQQTQKIFQNIWNRWKTEYLTSLQRRTKWCDPPVQLTPNQLVILRDEATAPMQWITARITELHPGPDGVTRVVTVQTPTGRFTRPVSKICILPIAPPDLASTETAALQESSTQPIIAEYHPIVVPAKQ